MVALATGAALLDTVAETLESFCPVLFGTCNTRAQLAPVMFELSDAWLAGLKQHCTKHSWLGVCNNAESYRSHRMLICTGPVEEVVLEWSGREGCLRSRPFVPQLFLGPGLRWPRWIAQLQLQQLELRLALGSGLGPGLGLAPPAACEDAAKHHAHLLGSVSWGQASEASV